MKILSLAMVIIIGALSVGFSQEKTDEKKWTIDPETGDTIYTQSVIISKSEDITPRNNMLIINPLKFLLFYNISYFYKVDEGTVIGAGVQSPTPEGVSGFGLNAEIRFYPTGKNMRGFYIAPNVSYNHLSDEDGNHSGSVSSVGALVGWQWFPGEQFAIGLGIGIDYYFSSSKSGDFEDFDGKAPLLRFDIGYAW